MVILKKKTENRFDNLFFDRLTENWCGISDEDFIGFIRPKCQEIITPQELTDRLRKKSRLRVKFGIDPTFPDVHLGHVVPIMLLRQFLKAGHSVELLIGDFTALVGDPSNRETAREPLSRKQIEKNMQTYTAQIGKYIDVTAVTIQYNSTWLSPMSLADVLEFLQQVNMGEAMQREDFRRRLKKSQPVSLAEVIYGVLMGIDSVQLKADVEVGGIDQLLNFQQCRKVMRQNNMVEEVALMTPILEGTSGDGRKMSKSYNNYIAVNASLEDKFGKIMSIPDRLIQKYYLSFADVHQKELAELDHFVETDPLEAKKQLATFIVALETRDIKNGFREREQFERKFSDRKIKGEDCISIPLDPNKNIFDLLWDAQQFNSKSQLRRLFQQSAVCVLDGSKESTLSLTDVLTTPGAIVRVGKRLYFKLQSIGNGR